MEIDIVHEIEATLYFVTVSHLGLTFSESKTRKLRKKKKAKMVAVYFSFFELNCTETGSST